MRRPEAHVEERGAGVPVILVHGAPSSPSGWRAIAERLPGRVVTVTLPGYASVEAPAGELVKQQEEALVAATAKYGEAVWVGFSFGANRILRLAAERRIAALALHCIGGFAWFEEDARAAMKQTAAAVASLADFQAEAVRAQFCPPMLSGPWLAQHPRSVDQVGQWLDDTSPRVVAEELRFAADLSPYDLSAIRVPVVARTGTADLNVPAERSEHLRKLLPQTVVERVNGAAHALLIEDVEGTAASIARLIETVR